LKTWKAPLKLKKSGTVANLNASPGADLYDRGTSRCLPDDEPFIEPVDSLFGLRGPELEGIMKIPSAEVATTALI
jgi:hypothetical protein